ncbi:MAG: efflux RND transporter periplasmic adaptor subunit [Acetobacteraceae bacterium]|nr:efflux RND transporter periplasmic adaptor subunit [Acetobacteraceae bacterium]
MKEALLKDFRIDDELADSSPPSSPKTKKRRFFFGRPVKITITALLMASAIFAILLNNAVVYSNNAVISAYTVSIRAPIGGYLSGPQVRVGDSVSSGSILARITNPRIDNQRLVDLKQLSIRQQSDLDAYKAERDRLISLRNSLLQRGSEYEKAEVEYFKKRSEEAAFLFQSKEEQRRQALRDLTRNDILSKQGWVSVSELERRKSTFDIAKYEAEAQLAEVGTLQIQAEAARRGLFLENGQNDVPYSVQRADEVSLRIAEIEREISLLQTTQNETLARLAEEENRVELLRSATLIAPSTGMVWKLGASDGELVAIGDTISELVDCGDVFILAKVPQSRFGDIIIGSVARYRFSGETNRHVGQVTAVTGELSLAGDRNLAATPTAERSPTAIVRIKIGPSENVAGKCTVGRTVNVWMPVSNGSLMACLLSLF